MKADLAAWVPKVRGVIAGHDYDPVKFPGVVSAVNEAFGPDGSYEVLETGTLPVLGFVRGDSVATLAVRWARGADDAQDAAVTIPDGAWSDWLTGRRHDGEVTVGALFADLPVALLVREPA